MHGQQPFNIFHDKEVRLIADERINNILEERPPGILYTTFLSSATKWLTGKAGSKNVVIRQLLYMLLDITFNEPVRPKAITVDCACRFRYIVSPNRIQAQTISGQSKPAYSSKKLDYLHKSHPCMLIRNPTFVYI